MYKRSIFFALAICSIWSLSACKKFLTVAPASTNVNPVSIKDFQEMLNSNSLSSCHYFLFDVMSDDLTMTDAQLAATSNYYQRSYSTATPHSFLSQVNDTKATWPYSPGKSTYQVLYADTCLFP
ncbi:hypothetical protein LX99_04634 [Mucilaginibacter oryzae]|uniref:RagB/SusD family nutrient uptake outer membrane protein n=1 Tax=Mucilaginibacter oryzae TaxID=468058 RepID=A0A316H0M5_9SPHI|nr:hypothetical protein [Mucilaginibacter oryzae]PWK69981.1 hypothetical protein LX99_04634 [Mucilaginibacter oryzae]